MNRTPPHRRPPGPGRRGFSLIESTIAVLLLMTAMATTVRALAWVARDRRAAERRAVALREAENLLDRLSLADPEAAPPALSDEAATSLPGGEVVIDRRPEEGEGPAMERLSVTIRYEDRPGEPARPVRLTTWVASKTEGSP
ncbi:hypothetical protein [Tautonia sociabilis]|uniref:hypothetical protein n=1 Tax=Tautonia sociabilis TaxID=2080755 RepID=UPI0013157865|nr:hypothetical protein [Tautonia sociabilis]